MIIQVPPKTFKTNNKPIHYPEQYNRKLQTPKKYFNFSIVINYNRNKPIGEIGSNRIEPVTLK